MAARIEVLGVVLGCARDVEGGRAGLVLDALDGIGARGLDLCESFFG